jgi:uncharacterized protein (TIGR03083 family)
MPMPGVSATPADALASVRADHAALLDLLGRCSAETWAAPSGCPGWSVKDLVTHLGTMFWRTADPSRLVDTRGLPMEVGAARDVEARAAWDATRVLDDYVEAADRALVVLEGLRDVDQPVPLGDLGTYPASMLACGYAFDLYTHLRADLLAPRGPLDAAPPPSDELRIAPTLAWILAALPQQCAATVGALPGAVELVLTGPAGGHFVLQAGGGFVTGDEARIETVASISCFTPALVWWATGRASWTDVGVQAAGDEHALRLLRDGIHVF